MGVGANKDVITAVLCKALLLPGTKADPRNVRHPVIDAVPEPVAPAAEEPEPLHPVLIPDAGVLPEEAAEAEEAEEKAEEQVKDHRWKQIRPFFIPPCPLGFCAGHQVHTCVLLYKIYSYISGAEQRRPRVQDAVVGGLEGLL